MSSDSANPYDSEANPFQPLEGNVTNDSGAVSASAVDSSQTDETTAKKP